MVKDFDAKLNEYAHLLVEIGMNVQPGQTARINAPVACAPLARMCAAACYDCGAREVIVDWHDDFIEREKYLRADEAVFSQYPAYMKAKWDWLLEKKAPNLAIIGEDPELLKGADPKRIQAWQRAAGEGNRAYYDAMTASRFQWSIGAYPVPAWAAKAFPELPEAQAMDALWDAIFDVCRITGDGKAVQRWR